jgi:hypothetical protein
MLNIIEIIGVLFKFLNKEYIEESSLLYGNDLVELHII